MKLGIIWYRNPSKDKYGNEIGYLIPSNHNRQTYRACDPGLYSELQQLVSRSMERDEERRIEDSINSPILPHETLHYELPIPRPANIASRKRWFNEAMDRTAESDVIFLNPDIGIDWDRKARLKYVHRWELEALLEKEKILVIYQHAQHSADWVVKNARKLRCGPLAVQHLWVCTWHPVSERGYFIAARTEKQRAKVEERLEILQKSLWVERKHILLRKV